MRTSHANRYARIAAILAAVITLVVLVIYLRRSWQARQDAKNAPPPVPASVQKTSQTFSFSKGLGTATLFTVRASHATEFKDTNRTALEDVWITVYGAAGTRSDNIHTRACDYQPDSGHIECAGEVQMELQSAEQAKRLANPSASGGASSSANSPATASANPQAVHVITRGLSFDRDSGNASTDQPVYIQFPTGEIHGIGAKYNSQNGGLQVLHAVQMTLRPAPSPAGMVKRPSAAAPRVMPPIEVAGVSMDYGSDNHFILIRGPVVTTQRVPEGMRELHSADLAVDLDAQFKARRITARGSPGNRAALHSTAAGGAESSVLADEFVAEIAPEGWIERLRSSGNVEAFMKTRAAQYSASAGHIEMEMSPKLNQPRTINASESVRLDAKQVGLSRHLETAALRIDFAVPSAQRVGARSSHVLQHLETLAPGTLSWEEPLASPSGSPANTAAGQSTTRLDAQRIEMDFAGQNRLRQLLGHNGSELHRLVPGQPEQTSTSRELAASFDAAGQWASVTQTGNVRLHGADRNGQAARGQFFHATNLMTLSGGAQVTDPQSHTVGDAISFDQTNGDMYADGHVLTTYIKPAGAAAPAGPNFGPEPAHVKSDHMAANSQAGNALYTGHARLWQGDSTIEADEIELNRPAQRMDARRNVRGLFLEAASTVSDHPAATTPVRSPARGELTGTKSIAFNSATQPKIWHVRSGTLTYWDAESRAYLDEGFTAESQEISVNAQSGDLFFSSSAAAPGGTPEQRIDHAVAQGNVTIQQADRHATADHGEYHAADGRVTLSGGTPTLSDTSGNITTGRQLTFYLADDRIVVQSDEGPKTVRRRVEK
jgi:lipopolysaccharide export system protein LptA/lipopolysaccharide export system protein LptC